MSWNIVEKLGQMACVLAIIEITVLLMAATFIAVKNIITEKWK